MLRGEIRTVRLLHPVKPSHPEGRAESQPAIFSAKYSGILKETLLEGHEVKKVPDGNRPA